MTWTAEEQPQHRDPVKTTSALTHPRDGRRPQSHDDRTRHRPCVIRRRPVVALEGGHLQTHPNTAIMPRAHNRHWSSTHRGATWFFSRANLGSDLRPVGQLGLQSDAPRPIRRRSGTRSCPDGSAASVSWTAQSMAWRSALQRHTRIHYVSHRTCCQGPCKTHMMTLNARWHAKMMSVLSLLKRCTHTAQSSPALAGLQPWQGGGPAAHEFRGEQHDGVAEQHHRIRRRL